MTRREQASLAMLLVALGLIAAFAYTFRGKTQDPEAVRDGAKAREKVDTRLPPPTSERDPRVGMAGPDAGPEAAPPGQFLPGVDIGKLRTIRDDRVFLREERDTWLNLLDVLVQTDLTAMREASLGHVTFAQLFRQPDYYRGKLVDVQGVVVRALAVPLAEKHGDIQRYFELWMRLDDNPDVPLVVHCLELPAGFPQGRQVSEEARITGFFYKRWAYPAQDGPRVAPLLLARGIQWTRAPVIPRRDDGIDGRSLAFVLAGAIVIAAWIAVTVYGKRLRRGASHQKLPEKIEIGLLLIGWAFAAGRCEAADVPTPPAIDRAHSTQAPPQTAAELLKTFGIDQTHLGQFADGTPLDIDELPTLLRCLFRSEQLPLDDVERLAQRDAKPGALASNPSGLRGEFFHLQGRVRAVEPQPVPLELVRRYQIEQYYRCRLEDQHLGPVVVFAREIPSRWRGNNPIDEPAGAWGMFLKLVPPELNPSAEEKVRVPSFAADRIAWYPDTALGRLGMDVGLLDSVKNRSAITGEEREAFYQMLAAVGRAAQGQLLTEAQQDLRQRGQAFCSVVPLFNQADQQHGRLVVLEGIARRAIKIVVDEPDIVARFGINHYFEIGLFTDDSQGNPLIFCVRQLPAGMPPGDGRQYAYRVRVAGFFFKTWAYRSSEGQNLRKDAVRGQLAPLLIGSEPALCTAGPPSRDTLTRGVLTGGLVVAMLAAWWTVWRIHRRKRGPPPVQEPPPRFDF